MNLDIARGLTVRQPWAWCIAHGGKHVENRSRPVSHRGPLLIHAGKGWSQRGATDPRVTAAWGGRQPSWVVGAVLAVADLVDVHPDGDCCRPWGESTYLNSDGRTITCWHYFLEDVRPLREPVPAIGRLGLWRPDPELVAAVEAQLDGVGSAH